MMNAFTHDFDANELDLAEAAMVPEAAAHISTEQVKALREQWLALHDAAHAVAQLAQLARDGMGEAGQMLPENAIAAGEDRLAAVERGISDLTLVMRTGLTALLAANAKGKDASAAALTLWLEFHAGRKAIIALVEPVATPQIQ